MKQSRPVIYPELSLNFHDNKKTGELMSRVIDDLNRLQEFIHHGPEAIIGSAVLLSGTVAIIFTLNVKLKGKIEFDDVHLAYDNQQEILKGINFTADADQTAPWLDPVVPVKPV